MLDEPALTTTMALLLVIAQAAALPASARRFCAMSDANGTGSQTRLRTESARLVRIMGTRAPRTIPAASAFARKVRLFASMLPASRSGTR